MRRGVHLHGTPRSMKVRPQPWSPGDPDGINAMQSSPCLVWTGTLLPQARQLGLALPCSWLGRLRSQVNGLGHLAGCTDPSSSAPTISICTQFHADHHIRCRTNPPVRIIGSSMDERTAELAVGFGFLPSFRVMRTVQS